MLKNTSLLPSGLYLKSEWRRTDTKYRNARAQVYDKNKNVCVCVCAPHVTAQPRWMQMDGNKKATKCVSWNYFK